jgi:hypothetical protein
MTLPITTSKSYAYKSYSFLNTLKSNLSWLPGNFCTRPRILKALLKAGLSKIVLGDMFTLEGSFARMGEQCFQRRHKNGDLSSFGMIHPSLFWASLES